MKVILIQDVKAQGKKGDIIETSDGYARNFLIPKKLAVEANTKNLTELKNIETSKRIAEEKERAAANQVAEKLRECMVKIQRTSGADGKMYGSVASKDIADSLVEQYNIEIDKRKIQLDEPIKTYGQGTVKVKLYSNISENINYIITK